MARIEKPKTKPSSAEWQLTEQDRNRHYRRWRKPYAQTCITNEQSAKKEQGQSLDLAVQVIPDAGDHDRAFAHRAGHTLY